MLDRLCSAWLALLLYLASPCLAFPRPELEHTNALWLLYLCRVRVYSTRFLVNLSTLRPLRVDIHMITIRNFLHVPIFLHTYMLFIIGFYMLSCQCRRKQSLFICSFLVRDMSFAIYFFTTIITKMTATR